MKMDDLVGFPLFLVQHPNGDFRFEVEWPASVGRLSNKIIYNQIKFFSNLIHPLKKKI